MFFVFPNVSTSYFISQNSWHSPVRVCYHQLDRSRSPKMHCILLVYLWFGGIVDSNWRAGASRSTGTIFRMSPYRNVLRNSKYTSAKFRVSRMRIYIGSCLWYIIQQFSAFGFFAIFSWIAPARQQCSTFC